MANANGGIDHLNASEKVARQSSRTLNVQMDHAQSHPLFFNDVRAPKQQQSFLSKWRHRQRKKAKPLSRRKE
jgi:hypothetical protein